MKRILLFFVAALAAFCANAQKVKQYKYWFDDAFNQAITPVITPVPLFKLAAAINGPLSPGFHRFSIQFSDDSLRYSSVASQYFYKPFYPVDTLIKKYEYWYDDDYAHKAGVTLTASAAVKFTLNGDERLLNAGLHKFSIRFGGDSIWSTTVSKYFVKQLVNVDTLIKGYEYWYDADYSHKVSGTVTTIAALNFTTSANAALLNAGQHTFNIRFRGDSLWGSPLSRYFIKTNVNVDTLIKGYEYWYDADYTHKVSGTVTGAAALGFTTNADASLLSTGTHSFNIRFRGDSLWGSTTSRYFSKIPAFRYDTAVKAYEYWFDADYAHKVSGGTTASALLNFSTTANAALLNAGQHTFNIRFRGDSLWSSPWSKYFIKQNVNVDTTIKGYEYWYDGDYTHKVSGIVTATTGLGFTTNADASLLSTGIHSFNIRFRGDSLWGSTASRYFSKIPAFHYDTAVKAYEYWYDNDYVNKTSGTTTASALVNFSANTNASLLKTGYHSFNIRFKGDSLWSSQLSRYFFKNPAYTDTTVKGYEYWYDSDYVHKISGTAAASALLNFNATADASLLNIGYHSFNIRFKGDSLWSSQLSRYFFKNPAYTDTTVKGYEYWYDNDYAHKITGTVTASAGVNFKTSADASSLYTGQHKFTIRFRGDSVWSSPLLKYFVKQTINVDTLVKGYEYWYDADYAHKVTGTITASATVSLNTNIDAASLSTGNHKFTIRFKGDSLWSSLYSQYFSKAPAFHYDTAVKAYEYWYDGDYAHKVTGTIAASSAASFKANIDAASLSTGNHKFTIRFRGDSLWSSPYSQNFSKAPVFHYDTAVKAYEYWYDGDYAHKVTGTVTASAIVSFKTTADASSLKTGFHSFNIRFKGDSLWSSPLSQYFYRSAVYADTLIKGYEYWYDDDYAHKISGAVTATSLLSLNMSADMSSISPGSHRFNIRFRGDSVWSAAIYQYIYKSTISNVSAYEYWFDDDYADKIDNAISPGAVINLTAAIDVSSLAEGIHRFNIRVRSDSSTWSSTVSQSFAKASGNITGYEYWFDNNYARKASLAVTAAASVNIAQAINTDSLAAGFHTFNIRAHGVLNSWSVPVSSSFVKIIPPGPGNVITGYRYWFDNSLAVTKVDIALPAPAAFVNITNKINTLKLDTGYHQIYIQARDTAGFWSATVGYKILIVQPVLIDSVISATTVCPSASFSISAQPYGNFGASNIFTAQLSDTAGLFASPITIGTLKASPSGRKQGISITAIMPFGIANSSKYRIRVISSSPALTSDSTSYPIIVQKPALGADTTVKICPGTFVNLTRLYNTTSLTPSWKIPRPDSVTTNGADTLTVTNTYGCKDTAVVTVSTYSAPVIQNVAVVGCNSVVYNGVTYSASAVKRDTVRSLQGCDSIYRVATITVFKITPVTQTTNISGCGSVVYNGITYTASATKTDTVRSVLSCDSIYKVAVITVTGNLTPPILSTTGTVTLCANDSLVLTTTATGSFQWFRNGNAIKNATLNRYVVNIAGVYMLKVTNGACTVVSASVTVNVTQIPKPVITLVNDTLVSSAPTGNQWYLNGRLMEGVTAQRFSPGYLGYYTVQVTINNCVSVMSDQFIYTANTFTKIGTGNLSVKMYPNPAHGEARLQVTGATGSIAVTITDIAGKTVWQSARLPVDKTIILPVAKFASATYIVTVRDRQHIVSLKLVKAK